MIVGVPKEIKDDEYRVSLVPAGVERLTCTGHRVLVEESAGCGSSISDSDYTSAGAEVVKSAEAVYDAADMIVKVKDPIPPEYSLIRSGQVVFTYFHFAASLELTEAMVRSGAVCVAYETVRLPDGSLPLLTPMSEVAGRMAAQEGAKYLEKPTEGRGVLLAGVPGVSPAKVVILGGGVVGSNAARIAAGMGANVTIMDINLDRLRYLNEVMPANVTTLHSDSYTVRREIADAELVIGAVLRCGGKAPVVVTRDMLKLMKPRAVMVDVAVDQGGCFETTRPTTHGNPTYTIDGVLHYCVANMPGAVPVTSTHALTNATFPYVLCIANTGYEEAARTSPAIKAGLNIASGQVTLSEIADQYDLPYTPADDLLRLQAAAN